MSKKKKPASIEDIQFENEFIKLKLAAEHGAIIQSDPNIDLPADLENEFLKKIIAFDKALHHGKRVRIFNILGKPAFKHARSLKKENLKHEIKKVLKLYACHSILVDCLSDTDPLKFYRFLTEELPELKLEKLNMEGWATHFTYEDFYPNDSYTLSQLPMEFLQVLFYKKSDMYSHLLNNKFSTIKGRNIPLEKVQMQLNYFRDAFDSFDQPEVEIKNLAFTKKRGSLEATVSYTAYSGNDRTRMHGPANFKFRKGALGYWYINSFSMPGLII